MGASRGKAKGEAESPTESAPNAERNGLVIRTGKEGEAPARREVRRSGAIITALLLPIFAQRRNGWKSCRPLDARTIVMSAYILAVVTCLVYI